MSKSARALPRRWPKTGLALIIIGILLSAFWIFVGSVIQKAAIYDSLYLTEMFGSNRSLWWDAHRDRIRLIGWQHYDFEMVGAAASKEDVPWILDGPEGEEFDDCAAGHRGGALRMITNQNAGHTREDWLKWWELHQNESQAEWILGGFHSFGLQVSLPLDHEAHKRLLSIIGKGTPDFSKKDWRSGVPDHIRFNAGRLLRDTGFDLKSITPEEVSKDATGDLLRGVIDHAGSEFPSSMPHPVFVTPGRIRSWPIASPWTGRGFLAASAALISFGWWLRRRSPAAHTNEADP